MLHKFETKFEAWLQATHARCSFLDSKQFDYVIWIGMLFQPLAIWSQAVKAWTAPSISGISITMFLMLLVLQSSGTLRAVKRADPILFIAMLGAFFGSLAVLAALFLRF